MESNKKPIGLVLSGGGANGYYAIRIIERLFKNGFNFATLSAVSGVSVGSIECAIIAQGDVEELIKVFKLLRNKDVYNGKLNVISLLLSIVKKRNYVLDIEPLYALLKKYISLEKAKKGMVFYIGTTDFKTGKYHTFTQHDFDNDDDYIRCIMASCTQPIIWKPQKFTTITGEVFEDMIDGGIVTISPINPILKHCINGEVIIINSSPYEIESVNTPKTLFSLLIRLIDLLIGQSFKKDMDKFINKNSKALDNDCSNDFGFFKSYIFQFNKYLPSLDFESAELNSIRSKVADEHFNEYLVNNNK